MRRFHFTADSGLLRVTGSTLWFHLGSTAALMAGGAPQACAHANARQLDAPRLSAMKARWEPTPPHCALVENDVRQGCAPRLRASCAAVGRPAHWATGWAIRGGGM